MKIVLILLLLIYVFAFFWFVYKSAANWRWYQLTSVSIVLLLAVTFLFPLAGVLKSRSSWQKVRTDLETRLSASEDEQFRLKYGDASDPSAGPGLLQVQQELQTLSMEVGRVWRNLRLQNAGPQGITLIRPQPQTPEGMPAEEPPPAAAGANAPPPVPLVPENIIVYGFAEQPTPGAPVPVPIFYLGEFRVTASQPNQVTLTPTTELTDAQKQRIGGQAASWSLYELLPLDGHEPFIAPGSTPTDEQLFGRVNEQLVRALLGQAVRPETLQTYLRDGGRAVANDPPKTRWVKVEFIKPYKVDVDSPEQRGALDGGFFDGVGRAVDSRLQRGGEQSAVEFDTGEQIVVKHEAAQQLIREGSAKLVDEYFVRPLNDYRFALRRLRLRIAEMANRRAELEHEQQVLNDALQATITMLASNQQDKLNLEKDAAQVNKERQAITDYNQTLQERIASTRQELASLYQSNLALAQQLEQYHSQLASQIDARTRAATP